MVGAADVYIIRITGGERRVTLVLQVDRVVVVQGKPLVVVLGQLPLGVEGGQPCGPGLLPGCGGAGGRLRRAGQRPGGSGTSGAANILLTFSSFSPSTEARLSTLARGILAVILNRRLSSSFNGCRAAIAAAHRTVL